MTQNEKFFPLGLAAIVMLFSPLLTPTQVFAERSDRPNVIVIFTDDQGYGDLGCFGSETIATPNLDRLAAEGRRFTSFYSACSVCSPSRAALLTGCYPKRVGMHRHVLFPQSDYGLNSAEYTIADHLKSNGYATAAIGKWHLGHHPETLPRANGFDSYFGIPYSNDMNHPTNKKNPRIPSDQLWENQETAVTHWNTPLVRNEEIIELPVDQRTITRRYTDEAIRFIEENQEQPFFLYLPHSMPHIPLYVPDDVYDPNPKNAYTCVIEHIDAEVGRIADRLRELGLDKNTLIIYTSDNGPWLQFKNHGGSAGPLRDGKGTTFEGGQRVPCIMWAPGRIPAGTSTNALVSSIDILPTIASFVDRPLSEPTANPTPNRIDGLDALGTLTSDSASDSGTDASPRNEFVFYSSRGNVEGIRIGDWKYLRKPKGGKKVNIKTPPTEFLFQLINDIGEQNNLVAEHPEIARRLHARMVEIDQEITANARPVWKKNE